MGNYETLNELLVTLFRDVMDIEQKVIITPEFKDITNNDMHVIEAIGIGEPKNMSSIARELSVTVGTLTIAMNSLVKKGYVERSRGLEDRRDMWSGNGARRTGGWSIFPCLTGDGRPLSIMHSSTGR